MWFSVIARQAWDRLEVDGHPMTLCGELAISVIGAQIMAEKPKRQKVAS